ncbi:hypothetical protein L9F63_018327, partial [Diploptera punctata]
YHSFINYVGHAEPTLTDSLYLTSNANKIFIFKKFHKQLKDESFSLWKMEM